MSPEPVSSIVPPKLLVIVPEFEIPSAPVFDTVIVPPELTVIVPATRLVIPVPLVLDTVIVPELVRILEFVMSPEPVSSIVPPKLLVIVPEFEIPTPPPLEIVTVPPELLIIVPPRLLIPFPVAVKISIVPSLVMVPEFETPLVIVTVIPAGIILLSAAVGTTPPTQVEESDQTPVCEAVMVAACTS
jgi:hypothetical protein